MQQGVKVVWHLFQIQNICVGSDTVRKAVKLHCLIDLSRKKEGENVQRLRWVARKAGIMHKYSTSWNILYDEIVKDHSIPIHHLIIPTFLLIIVRT